MADATCPKCGSGESIPDVQVIDHGHLNMPMALCATVYRDPDATFFKSPASHRFRAQVCGGCGYTEFYVDKPASLLASAKKAKRPPKPKRADA
jgi:predicted nucleic-acid-binding Zn-ribbon protein